MLRRRRRKKQWRHVSDPLAPHTQRSPTSSKPPPPASKLRCDPPPSSAADWHCWQVCRFACRDTEADSGRRAPPVPLPLIAAGAEAGRWGAWPPLVVVADVGLLLLLLLFGRRGVCPPPPLPRSKALLRLPMKAAAAAAEYEVVAPTSGRPALPDDACGASLSISSIGPRDRYRSTIVRYGAGAF